MLLYYQRCLVLLFLLGGHLVQADGDSYELYQALASEDDCVGEASGDSAACAFSTVQLRVARSTALQADKAHASREALLAQLAARYFDGRVAEAEVNAEAEHLRPLLGLTGDERLRYRQRFIDAISTLQSSASPPPEALHQVFLDQEPIITEWLVQRASSTNQGWKAGVSSWANNLTVQESKTLMGFISDHSIQEVPADVGEDPNAMPEDVKKLPQSFDSRVAWPRCREVFMHLRDQGKCGSCWAFAAAGTMDGRLCIASNGLFSGEKAWISAGYIASCYPMTVYPNGKIDGCKGGNPGSALSAASRGAFNTGGVPTGGTQSTMLKPSHEGCVPWFGKGSALEHFLGENPAAPECPKACTDTQGYGRILPYDKFYPEGKVQTTTRYEEMQVALVQGGPLPFAFKVYRDFMAYKGGYYDKTTDEVVGDHSAIVIGYTKYNGQNYLIGMNSWGSEWGDGSGIFKLQVACCGLTYYLPQIGGQQASLPFPGGPTEESLAEAEDRSCVKSTGGSCRLMPCDASRGPTECVNGDCMCQLGYCEQGGACVKREAVTVKRECTTRTGGTCIFSRCHASRGATHCKMGSCECDPGYCEKDGTCLKE